MSNVDFPQFKVTLVKSPISRLKAHKACLTGLGLRKINQSVLVTGTPSNLGMIKKVDYMLQVEEVN